MAAPDQPAPARTPASRIRQPGSRPPSFASQTPFSLGGTLKRIARHEKNGCRFNADLSPRCFRVALDLVRASRHRQPVGSSGGCPMRDLFTSLKRLGPGAALGVLFGLFAFGQASQAAYPWALHFWV